jgi:hypothetical protein
VPEELRGPFVELQTFCSKMRAESDMSPETLVEGLERICNAFKDPLSKGVHFKFPEDLLANIEPVDILRMVGDVIPDPARELFLSALDRSLLPPSTALIHEDAFDEDPSVLLPGAVSTGHT